MGKRSGLIWFVISILSLLFLIQAASADLVQIVFSVGLSIPRNSWTVESGTVKHRLTHELLFQPDRLEIFEQRISQMLVIDRKSAAFSFDVLMEPFERNTDVFATSLDGRALHTSITNFKDSSFRGTTLTPNLDLSSLTGKTSTLISELWH